MKIVIINGSPRKNGCTTVILNQIQTELTLQGADVIFYNLSDIRMKHCMGCMSCFKSGHCHMDDDMDRISKEIEQADGLVLGSPTYASNVTGLMKDFIDRGHFVMEQMLHGKPCITVTTGINYGKNDANHVLRRLVIYSGGYISARISVNIPFNDAASAKNQTQTKSVYAAHKMISDIRRNRKPIFQTLFNKIVFHAGIKPFVYSNRDKYIGVINKWKKWGLLS